jgi:adenine-specific DNA-methyltransferase
MKETVAIAPGLAYPALPLETSPADDAAYLGGLFLQEQPATRRRELAQFFTPLPVARFMAKLARPGKRAHRILDPGAGSGILACALLEELPDGSGPVHVDAYEIDHALARICRSSLEGAKSWLASRGVEMTFEMHAADFVTENAACLSASLFAVPQAAPYDIAILNPPYFKLQKADPRARAASEVVHGQPNIYALFMAITASLLGEKGVMVSITPRSFTTGDYFRRFRKHLFSQVTPEAVHLFDSRQDAFSKDEVLQENVIVRARKTRPTPKSTVQVSVSAGIGDLRRRRSRPVPLNSVVDLRSRDLVFHIPTVESDDEILVFVRAWPATLGSLGFAVSTGPIVSFRARQSLAYEAGPDESTVPLLLLHHVLPMAVRWPLAGVSKAQYFRVDETTRKLIVPSGNYVVMRRFSAKEEKRRLVASPLFGREFSGHGLGLENHLNYVYRPRGAMTRTEAIGLAAILGSSLLDRYFRVSNGNTQVNATELRALPLPPLALIKKIGEELMRSSLTAEVADHVVAEVLRVPRHLGALPQVSARG